MALKTSALVTTGKQLITVQHGWVSDIEVSVAIDFDFPEVKQKIKDMSLFWSGHPTETAPFEEHLVFWLGVLANEAYVIKVGENYNNYGVCRAFNENEGYWPLDGTHGIILKSVCGPVLESDEYEISSQEAYTGDFALKVPD